MNTATAMKGITQMNKSTIDMAREAGLIVNSPYLMPHDHALQGIKAFEALVRADEREQYKWDIHSCGPTCKRYACVAMREAIEAEREACAKLCDDAFSSSHAGRVVCDNLAYAIRARGNT